MKACELAEVIADPESGYDFDDKMALFRKFAPEPRVMEFTLWCARLANRGKAPRITECIDALEGFYFGEHKYTAAEMTATEQCRTRQMTEQKLWWEYWTAGLATEWTAQPEDEQAVDRQAMLCKITAILDKAMEECK